MNSVDLYNKAYTKAVEHHKQGDLEEARRFALQAADLSRGIMGGQLASADMLLKLIDDDIRVRELASSRDAEYLLQCIGTSNEDDALKAMEHLNEREIPSLLSFVCNSEAPIRARCRVAYALGSLGKAQAVPALLALLADRAVSTDGILLGNAIRNLKKFDDARILTAILPYLEHPEEFVRTSASQVLGRRACDADSGSQLQSVNRLAFSCPKCGRKLWSDAANAGKRTRCKCGLLLDIPKDASDRVAHVSSKTSGSKPHILQIVRLPRDGVMGMDISPDGAILALTLEKELRLLDADTGQVLWSTKCEICDKYGARPKFFPNSSHIIVEDYDSVLVFETESGQCVFGPLALLASSGDAEEIAARYRILPSRCGTMIVVVGSLRNGGGAVLLLDAQSGQEKRRWSMPPFNSCALSPTTDMIAIGDAGGHVVIWSLEGSQVKELSCHDGKTGALAFSPDGRLLASAGSDDGVVSITELESGAFIHRFPTYSTTPATFEQVHPGTGKTWCALVGKHPVGTLAITPGNEVVIAGVSCSCFEGRVWDVASERERHPVKSFREFHLSEDGRRIVIEDNHEIYVYPLDAFIR